MAGNYSNTGSWTPQVHTVGLRNVGSYVVSGHPYLTGSVLTGSASGSGYNAQGEKRVQFPYVTQRVTVTNLSGGGTVRIHFASQSAGNVISGKHYVELPTNTSTTLEVKCKEIYFSIDSTSSNNASLEIIADLTNIPPQRMYALTGSGITE